MYHMLVIRRKMSTEYLHTWCQYEPSIHVWDKKCCYQISDPVSSQLSHNITTTTTILSSVSSNIIWNVGDAAAHIKTRIMIRQGRNICTLCLHYHSYLEKYLREVDKDTRYIFGSWF